jgi:tetratricopeptide (TPR) repeat protein
MLELIVMISVIGWFAKTAKEKNKNKILWGLIGALSFYIPVLVFGLLIYPLIIIGWVNKENEFSFKIIGIVLNILVGTIGILIAKRILQNSDLSSKSKKHFTLYIVGGVITLLVSVYALNYLKLKSGISIDGFENFAGNQKLDKGDYTGAIEEYNKAIMRQPNESTLYRNRGLAFEKSKDYSKSLIDFNHALRINNFTDQEQYINTFYEIGNCYGALNQLDSCVKYYLKKYEFTPNDKMLKLNIAYIYDKLGKTDESCIFLQGITNLEPKFQETYDNLKMKCKE